MIIFKSLEKNESNHYKRKPKAQWKHCRCAGGGGTTATFDVLNKYFLKTNMPVVPSQYWNIVHGTDPGEAVQDLEGMQTMRQLARNMAFMIKSIALGKEKYGIPEEEPRVETHFIR